MLRTPGPSGPLLSLCHGVLLFRCYTTTKYWRGAYSSAVGNKNPSADHFHSFFLQQMRCFSCCDWLTTLAGSLLCCCCCWEWLDGLLFVLICCGFLLSCRDLPHRLAAADARQPRRGLAFRQFRPHYNLPNRAQCRKQVQLLQNVKKSLSRDGTCDGEKRHHHHFRPIKKIKLMSGRYNEWKKPRVYISKFSFFFLFLCTCVLWGGTKQNINNLSIGLREK